MTGWPSVPIFGRLQPPEHAFELTVVKSDGSTVVIEIRILLGLFARQRSAQRTHSLSYRLVLNEVVNDATLEIRLSSNSAYAFNITEVMVFGEAE